MWPSIIEGLGFSSAGDGLSCPRFLAGELAEACTVMRRSEPVQPDSGWADVADITIATEQSLSFWALEPNRSCVSSRAMPPGARLPLGEHGLSDAPALI